MSLPIPAPQVAIALASVAVHAQEAMGPGGHDFDRLAIEAALQTPGVSAYLAELEALALLPRVRSAR